MELALESELAVLVAAEDEDVAVSIDGYDVAGAAGDADCVLRGLLVRLGLAVNRRALVRNVSPRVN